MDINVSIIASPQNGELKIENELRLIKVALLYSDKITILSPTISIIAMMSQLALMSRENKKNLIKGLIPVLTSSITSNDFDALDSLMRKLKNKNKKTSEEIIRLRQYERIFDKFDNDLLSVASKLVEDAKMEKIKPLIDNGLLEIQNLDLSEGFNPEEYAKKMLDEALNVMSNDYKYPLFDSTIENLITAYIEEQKPIINFENPKEIELGKELMFKLPNIDKLSFNQILDLKSDLSKHLLNFKAAVNEYSMQVKEIPYSESSKKQIDKLFEYTIRPQLIEIQDKVKKNRFINVLLDNIMPDSVDLSVFVGLSTISNMETIYKGLGVVIPKLYRINQDFKDRQESIENNKMFFYHKMRTKK